MVEPGVEFQLREREMVGIRGSTTAIVFDRVLEDSRCPMNARCIWEGNARISVKAVDFLLNAASPPDHSQPSLELNTSEHFSKRASFRGFTTGISVQLRALEPTPMTGVPTTDYVATLVVEVEQ